MTDTLAAPATHALEVRHSRFLAHAAPVDAPAAAMAFIARASEPEATHNCWAWRIGQEYRSSDDGEPAGTGGRPILAAIDGQGCDRVAVVVTRWYGGIKLGAGGLVRAYGGTAAECLRLAERRPLVAMAALELACAFEDLGAVHVALAPWRLPVDSPWTWLGALVAYDFLYYWHHRAGHRVAVFWAAHVVHHQSEDYNLSTALRQTSSGWLFGWIFYLPMALAGVPPLVFGVVALIDLLYQFWVHTEQVGRLGWFDRWFCAPSNHRVHHAVNDAYLDRNYGGILIVWDRLFGTYAAEDPATPCIYGTRGPLRSWNPIRANLQVYAGLARDAWRTRRLVDKAAVWLKPPGWRPPDLVIADPKPAFDLASVERFDTMMSRKAQVLAVAIFVGLLAGTSWLLWNAHRLAWPVQAGAATTILVGLWLLGRVSEGPAAREP